MAAIQLVFNWIIYSTNVSHVCEQVETTNNTYWHLWQTYLPMPRAFSLALHSRHRALNEHSTNISSMKRIWLMTWQVFCYKPSHYTLSYKATRENITYYAMNTLHWWRSSAQLWLQAKKQRARIFRKPLASYLSAEHQRSVYCTSGWLTYLSRFAAQTVKEKLTELLDSSFQDDVALLVLNTGKSYFSSFQVANVVDVLIHHFPWNKPHSGMVSVIIRIWA